jgi:uncharacterized protein YihD (DUF1040 family)
VRTRGYLRSVKLSKLCQAMKYRQSDFERDWDLAIAISILLANGSDRAFQGMLEDVMDRVIAYQSIEPQKCWQYMNERDNE